MSDVLDEPRYAVHVPAPLTVRVRAFFRGLIAKAQGRRAELYCLCWIVPSWIAFELIATKLPPYTLPLYPPIALLAARGLLQAGARARKGVDDGAAMLGHRIWVGIGFLICAGLPLGVAIPFGPWWVKGVAGLTAALACWVLWRAWRRVTMNQLGGAQSLSIIAVAVTYAGTLGVILPHADGLWISPKLDDLIRVHNEDGIRPVGAVGYHEDSLVFLTRGTLDKADDVRTWAHQHPRGLLIARPEDIDTANMRGPALTELGRVRGYNYSNGRIMDLVVYRVGP